MLAEVVKVGIGDSGFKAAPVSEYITCCVVLCCCYMQAPFMDENMLSEKMYMNHNLDIP